MNFLITGGAGFIASHLISNLLEDATTRITIVDPRSAGLDIIREPRIRFLQNNLNDLDTIRSLRSEELFDGVFHLAAKKSVMESIRHPESYFDANFDSTKSLIEISKYLDISRIVFTSSAAVYGQIATNTKITETYSALPINPYGESKLFAEKFLEQISSVKDLHVSCLRLFNVIGPMKGRESLFRNEDLLSKIFQSVISGETFHIRGSDLNTIDGSPVRDYVDVRDVSEVLKKIMSHLLVVDNAKTSSFDIVNVGSGEGTSVLQMVQAVESITGEKIKSVSGSPGEGEPESVVADIRHLRTYIPWKLKYDLQQTIRDSWQEVKNV
jgi:UDP-glucose 4-epimerase